MSARLARTLSEREPLLVAVAAAAAAALAYLGVHRGGTNGLALPVAVVVLVILMRRPAAMVALVTTLAIVCEGEEFGLLSHLSSRLYDINFFHELDPLDVLVALTVVSAGIDLIRTRRRLLLPRPLLFSTVLLALAMLAGGIAGHAAGTSVRAVLLGENTLLYLLLLPLVVANLELDRRRLKLLVGWLVGLAIFKAIIGLIEVFGHYGVPVEGHATLSYYEPPANWTIMCALLGLAALGLAGMKPPRWALLGVPLLFACLLLSYRRSFWVASVLGILLVVVIGSSPAGRKMLVPAGLLVAVAIWALGSSGWQPSGSPIARRAVSLDPTKLESNVEDSYRLDERANVLGAIGEAPVTGLGVGVPWSATFRPLSVEHNNGRQYVHFAALWFWLKLGILGLAAYLATVLAAIALSWQAWRRSPEPALRAFALASLCAVIGLMVMDTTASFTGVEPRFTVVFAVQLGLLALLARTAPPGDSGLPALSPGSWLRPGVAARSVRSAPQAP